MGERAEPHGGRFRLGGRSLRAHAARGTLVNSAFLIGVNGLALLRGFVVAGFVARDDYGVWGVLTISLGTLFALRQLGVADKYVQQDEPDQERAFHIAFTLELASTIAFWVLLSAFVPVLALIYGESELIAPGLVFLLCLPAVALQSPLWVFYRRMDFGRQRALQAIDPILAFAACVGLAAAGAGYWALVAGSVLGAWAAACAALVACPYSIRLRWDPAAAREYLRFSWPLAAAAASGLVIAQGTMLAGEAKLGLAGAGAITLASAIIQYADRVDQIVTQTLYPAIAAARDRLDLLHEAFVKSNRLALMWGAPFGVGVALFADPLVAYLIGEKWRPAVGLLQAFGVLAAINHVGFNWSAFFRARGETKPMAVLAAVMTVTFLGGTLPALIAWGLDGLAAGMALLIAVSLTGRAYYLTRLFTGFSPLRHALRGLAPTIPAAALILGARALDLAEPTAARAAAELVAFVLVTVLTTVVFERPLLREVGSYLRERRAG